MIVMDFTLDCLCCHKNEIIREHSNVLFVALVMLPETLCGPAVAVDGGVDTL